MGDIESRPRVAGVKPHAPDWEAVPAFETLLDLGFSRRLLYAWAKNMGSDADGRLLLLREIHDRLATSVPDAAAWFETPLLSSSRITPELLVYATCEAAVLALVDAAVAHENRVVLILDLYMPGWEIAYKPWDDAWDWDLVRDSDGNLSVTQKRA